MLKKSLMGLIGIFTAALLLSSCNTARLTVLTPAGERDNGAVVGGGSGGGGDSGDVEKQVAPIILQNPSNLELCFEEGSQQRADFEIVAVGADTIRWIIIIGDDEFPVNEESIPNLISSDEKLSFTAEFEGVGDVSLLAEACNNVGCVRSELAWLTVLDCAEENTDYTEYFSFVVPEVDGNDINFISAEEQLYPVASECAPDASIDGPSSSFIKLVKEGDNLSGQFMVVYGDQGDYCYVPIIMDDTNFSFTVGGKEMSGTYVKNDEARTLVLTTSGGDDGDSDYDYDKIFSFKGQDSVDDNIAIRFELGYNGYPYEASECAPDVSADDPSGSFVRLIKEGDTLSGRFVLMHGDDYCYVPMIVDGTNFSFTIGGREMSGTYVMGDRADTLVLTISDQHDGGCDNEYTISASASEGGTITSSFTDCAGFTKSFLIEPSEGYKIVSVLLDDVISLTLDDIHAASETASGWYEFQQVQANHSLSVTFAAIGGSGEDEPVSVNTAITSNSGAIVVSIAASSTITIPYSLTGTSRSLLLSTLEPGEPNQSWDYLVVGHISDPVENGDTLVVTAQDGQTTATYTIVIQEPVPVLSDIAEITSDTYTISEDGEGGGTISGVPFGTTSMAFMDAIVHEYNQHLSLNCAHSSVESGDTLVSTSEDGSSTITYEIVVNQEASTDAGLVWYSIAGTNPTSLPESSETIAGAVAASITIISEKATDTDYFSTTFSSRDKTASIRAVKFMGIAPLPSEKAFASEVFSAYNNEEIADGDYFIIKVTAAAGNSLYYRVDVTVLPIYAVGNTGPGNGKIFYINANYKTDGWRYLEAAEADIAGTFVWSSITNQSVKKGGATPVDIGFGLGNTGTIVGQQMDAEITPSGAAAECDNSDSGGYSGWFLPSKNELAAMYTALRVPSNLGGFVDNVYYWSSSEFDSSMAWSFYFSSAGNGMYFASSKNAGYIHTRCVRYIR